MFTQTSLRPLLRTLLLVLCTLMPLAASAMTDLNGRTSSIERYKGHGKWLVVEAWHSTCRICGMSMPALARSVNQMPNAHIMSVSLDGNRHKAIKFLQRHKIRIPALVSSMREFNGYLQRIAQERLTGTPTYLIFNPQGDLLGLQSGYISASAINQFMQANR